ncbi:MAG: YigZ family protein [Bacteroidota bacterium]
MSSDQYQTIERSSTGEYKDRGSKFMAYAYPAATEQDWQAALEEVRKLHPKARHHCYAFRLGLDGNSFRANDDGEPSGSAGRPILGQIDSFGLTNVIIIVIRYFGGTKLGVPGLIAAYKGSARQALEQAQIVQKSIQKIYRFDFPYSLMSDVMNAVKKFDASILQQEFTEAGMLQVAFPRATAEDEILKIKAHIAKLSVEAFLQMEKEIPDLQIEYLSTR